MENVISIRDESDPGEKSVREIDTKIYLTARYNREKKKTKKNKNQNNNKNNRNDSNVGTKRTVYSGNFGNEKFAIKRFLSRRMVPDKDTEVKEQRRVIRNKINKKKCIINFFLLCNFRTRAFGKTCKSTRGLLK